MDSYAAQKWLGDISTSMNLDLLTTSRCAQAKRLHSDYIMYICIIYLIVYFSSPLDKRFA